jgi:hypothetical protein
MNDSNTRVFVCLLYGFTRTHILLPTYYTSIHPTNQLCPLPHLQAGEPNQAEEAKQTVESEQVQETPGLRGLGISQRYGAPKSNGCNLCDYDDDFIIKREQRKKAEACCGPLGRKARACGYKWYQERFCGL